MIKIDAGELFLVEPREEYAEQIVEYRKEFLDAGDSMDGTGPLRVCDDPVVYIAECEKHKSTLTLPEGRVIATQFFCVRKEDDRIVGMIQVRHYMNEYLSMYAGNIGYSVRPSERRKGYATSMLGAVLPYCREIGLDKILISCHEGNIGSEKTILSNGGIYESTVEEPGEELGLKRFWITL